MAETVRHYVGNTVHQPGTITGDADPVLRSQLLADHVNMIGYGEVL